jgi:hypothetical protein
MEMGHPRNFHSLFVTSDLAFHSPKIRSWVQPKGESAILSQTAKSLLRNILRVSPNGSRFCEDAARPAFLKFFENNILGRFPQKKQAERRP